MYAFLIVVHVFVCLVLIAVILLQAGRGGGLSDAVGGGAPQSILGTQTNVFMTRATEVCAVIFIITSLSLGIVTTQRGKSLMEKQLLLNQVKKNMKQLPQAPEAVPAAPAAPVAPAAESPVAASVDNAAAATAPAPQGNAG